MVVTAELYARNVLGVTESDRFFSTAKLFFAYGLGNALYFPLLVGATSILQSAPARPKEVYEAIERYQPTLLFSVPSSYAAALNFQRPEGGDYDLSSVRHAVSAGECLPAALFHRFKERFGIEILDAIGSTEALHMFIANRPGAVRPGSSGQILPGCEARILDDEKRAVATGEVGNLYIRSDAVCACYWHQHEKSKETFDGHWVRTGDKYSVDSDGYYWYAGRSDDMLKVSGAWVSPIEIENTLVEHEAVAEVAVVGRSDGDNLVKPAAWIVVNKGFIAGPELAARLKEFIGTRLPKYKIPRWVEFVDELPKTATGKLQRFKLRG
jgi:benzoate-CoA ligase